MTSRRDWQLQQLGIAQWTLRRPAALQGEVAITLPEHVRLVMVAQTLPPLTEPLISDVLRARRCRRTSSAADPRPRGDAARRRALQQLAAGRRRTGGAGRRAGCLPDYQQLRTSAAARAALWQQICAHEHDFYPQHD